MEQNILSILQEQQFKFILNGILRNKENNQEYQQQQLDEKICFLIPSVSKTNVKLIEQFYKFPEMPIFGHGIRIFKDSEKSIYQQEYIGIQNIEGVDKELKDIENLILYNTNTSFFYESPHEFLKALGYKLYYAIESNGVLYTWDDIFIYLIPIVEITTIGLNKQFMIQRIIKIQEELNDYVDFSIPYDINSLKPDFEAIFQ